MEKEEADRKCMSIKLSTTDEALPLNFNSPSIGENIDRKTSRSSSQDLLGDVSPTFFNYYLDFTFVVDTAIDKELVDRLNYQFFEHFFQTVREQKNKRNCDIRAQIMSNRRDKENYWGGESIFFELPEGLNGLSKYTGNTTNREILFKANSICSILKRSLNYKFRNDGSKESHVIIFLSDKEDDICAENIRNRELTDFYSAWSDNCGRRLLCLMTPYAYPYSEFEVDLENTIHFDIEKECTWAEWKDALEMLADLL